jgi:hypothetical protein
VQKTVHPGQNYVCKAEECSIVLRMGEAKGVMRSHDNNRGRDTNEQRGTAQGTIARPFTRHAPEERGLGVTWLQSATEPCNIPLRCITPRM